jgi:hypothetical protein
MTQPQCISPLFALHVQLWSVEEFQRNLDKRVQAILGILTDTVLKYCSFGSANSWVIFY